MVINKALAYRLLKSTARIFLLVVLFTGAYVSWQMGSDFSEPSNHAVGPAPAALQAVDVEFGGVKGWLAAAGHPAPCMLLMHGVRADRRAMLQRALFFKAQGYTVLLFDFQAHGESPGDKITFGARESANAHAAVDFLHQHGQCTGIAAIGVSMGGAAALLGNSPLPVDALILESVYPTIEEAIADRLEHSTGHHWARYFAPVLYVQIPLRLHMPVSALHPVDAIAHVHCPVFVIAGDADKSTHADESRRLFEAAPEPKQFWLVPGAGHIDMYHRTGKEYEQRVLAFLQKYLPAGAATH